MISSMITSKQLILLHEAFSDNEPFYLGYVTADFTRSISKHPWHYHLYKVTFQPSFTIFDDSACACYIGKNNNEYFPILPKNTSKQQIFVCAVKYSIYSWVDMIEWKKRNNK